MVETDHTLDPNSIYRERDCIYICSKQCKDYPFFIRSAFIEDIYRANGGYIFDISSFQAGDGIIHLSAERRRRSRRDKSCKWSRYIHLSRSIAVCLFSG